MRGTQNGQSLANFVWSVADLLRGDYKQHEYGQVILPFTLLRRLDYVLEPTKAAVLRELERRKGSGVPVHEIARLDGASLLYKVVQKFTTVDLHPDTVSNADMGSVFEELIRRFAELSNATAGEHYTPRQSRRSGCLLHRGRLVGVGSATARLPIIQRRAKKKTGTTLSSSFDGSPASFRTVSSSGQPRAASSGYVRPVRRKLRRRRSDDGARQSTYRRRNPSPAFVRSDGSLEV